MQPRAGLKKIRKFGESFLSRYTFGRTDILLFIFLLTVLLISFIIPNLVFGRFFGTDDYTHLFHTKEMLSSIGLMDFYQNMGAKVSNPGSGANAFNYPFGLWVFGATIGKIIGMPLLSAELIFVLLFFLILVGSFYVYSGAFLKSKEQKIFAVLFLLSMPNTATSLLSYWPSIFIMPFLFILMYIALKEPVQWKLFPIAWLSIFIITVSHTGSFMFLVLFSITFFLLYCLLWGRFSLAMYIVILSTFFIYIFSLKWFPEIANQYYDKTILILNPGNFLATKFNFSLPLELSRIFYQNMFVNQEFLYTIILGAFIFTIGKLFVYIYRKVSEQFSQSERVYAFTLPISNISHSAVAAPVWVGPIQVFLSFFGYFRINSTGKCMLIAALLITLTPDILLTQQGFFAATGALREISFLALIIPITAALGLGVFFSYLEKIRIPYKNFISLFVWILLLSAIIITPILATTYYLPKIAGEDYVIEGMQWLGSTGDLHEKVLGVGYRTIPIYTNMTDASYGIMSGTETITYGKLINGIFFSRAGNNVKDLQRLFGVSYILSSDRVAANFGRSLNEFTIDNNPALDKIYSSKDFGVYEITSTPEQEKQVQKTFIAENISFQKSGASLQFETEAYKVVLNADSPVIEQFGSPQDNYLGEGYIFDIIQIYGLRQTYVNPYEPAIESLDERLSMSDQFILSQVPVTYEMHDNQITYRTVLKDQQAGNNEASLLIRYTFYPKTIKREVFISNDWVTTSVARNMNVRFATNMFTPLNDFIIKNDKTRITRHIYPTQDSVVKYEVIPELYVHNGKKGIYIKNEPTSVFPQELTYGGSTQYNMSSLNIAQSASLKPGATLYITQFFALGDEITAEKNILSQEGISLLNYPEGIIPISLVGSRSPYTDSNSNASIWGYQVLREEDIPYSEVIVPEQLTEPAVGMQNSSESSSIASAIPNITHKIDLRTIAIEKTTKFIGSGSTGTNVFDSFSTQEHSISALIDYAQVDNVSWIGYMPASMKYNLDTLQVISDKKIPFILSRTVSPPYFEYFGQENKNPELAILHNTSLDVTLFPVSTPFSIPLSSQSDSSEMFSAWKTSIDEAAANEGMILFIMRAEDIGNPVYTEDFKELIKYAKNKGMTFTSPDTLSNHFKNIQNIHYSGSIEADTATINLTNDNNNMVQQVTFRVVLPVLNSGNYSVSEGKIVKMKQVNNQVIIYVSTDIPAHTTKEITINPSAAREKIMVILPKRPVEGQITISIQDATGNPLRNVEAIIDSKYYYPDAKGNVNVDLTRGVHMVKIQSPGYETYNIPLIVKGRVYLFDQFLRDLI